VARSTRSWLDVAARNLAMEKPMDRVSADHQDHTFSAATAITMVLRGASAIALTVAFFTLFCYGALALFDCIAG
jgi:hypothetical protein